MTEKKAEPPKVTEQNTRRVLIQGVGEVMAKPLTEFQPGECYLWAGGWVRQIVSMTPQKGGRILVVYREEGKIYEATYRKSRLLAIAQKTLEPRRR